MNNLFQPGQKPSLGMQPGKSYPAYLFPVSESEVISGQYGDAYKLRYALVVGSGGGGQPPKVFELSELAAQTDAINSKLVERMCVVSGVAPAEDMDLASLHEEGWCLVGVVKDPKDERYLKVGQVTAIPDGMPIPSVEFAWDSAGQMYMNLITPTRKTAPRGNGQGPIRRPGFAGPPERDQVAEAGDLDNEPPF